MPIVNLLDLPSLDVVGEPRESQTAVAEAAAAQPAVAKAVAAIARPATIARQAKQRGPTKKAIQHYRDGVLAAVESGSNISLDLLVYPAWKTGEECRADCKLYVRRLGNKHDLDVLVPELERKAAEAERIARETPPWAERTMTGREWQALADSGQLMMPPREHQAAQVARQMAGMARQEALQALRETCDPELHRQIGELEQTRSAIMGTMTARQQGVLNIDGRIAKQRALVDAIVRGDDLAHVIGPVHRSRGEENERARRQLDYLLDQAQQKPQAEVDQAADQTRMAEIVAEIKKLEQMKLDPRRMMWS